jgi:membrane associated rhomboid family serine protease
MILPISHEDMVARRWPIVTTAIILVSIACFALQVAGRGAGQAELMRSAERLAHYWQERPYLVLHAPCDRLFRHAPPPRAAGEDLPSDEDVAAEQAHLDALCADVESTLYASPEGRFGWVPARRNWVGLVTHQFLHGGVLHLVFNMWFLWLCGCNLEDRWGRAVFAPFYLSAGVAAALAHSAASPQSLQPMIGASGAIAGAMGAFLVAFARTRIRFVYLLFFRPGTFAAPAYVMLPLWLANEVVFGALPGVGDGVAHWAHIGGFAYGVVFALAMRMTGIEARLDAAVERKVTVTQDERIMRAAEMTSAGDARGALALLAEVARERPADIDVQLERLRAAKAAVDRAQEGDAYADAVRLYVDAGELDTAVDLLGEAVQQRLGDAVSTEVRARLGDRLVVKGLLDRAWWVYDSVTMHGLPDAPSVRAALAQAKVARRLGRPADGRPLLQAVLGSPFSSAELDEAARGELARGE